MSEKEREHTAEPLRVVTGEATDESQRLQAWPSLRIACPYGPCGANPGEWCRDFLGGIARRTHKKRRDAARTPTS